MAPELILCSKSPDDLAFAKEAASSGKLTLKKVKSFKELASGVSPDSQVLVGVEEIPPGPDPLSALKCRIHLLAPAEKTPSMDRLISSDSVAGFIYSTANSPGESGMQFGRTLGKNPSLTLGSSPQNLEFAESIQKGFAALALSDFIQELGLQERIGSIVGGAVDELLMNAMFDAAVDEHGKPLYDKTPRNTNLKLIRGVSLEASYDDQFVAITITDRFGSLDRERVLRHAAKSHSGLHEELPVEYAGAGLGLAFVVRSGASLFFRCERGKRTDVTLFFRRTDRVREFKGQFQFVSTQIN